MDESTKNYSKISKNLNSEKRKDYLEWDEYFMAITFLESRKCLGVGDAAIVLNQRKIISSMANSNVTNDNNNYSHVNHAVYKALCKVQEGAVMYTTTFPCDKCAEAMIEAGIVEIIYYKDRTGSEKAKDLLRNSGIFFRQFISKRKKIEIDFSQFCKDL